MSAYMLIPHNIHVDIEHGEVPIVTLPARQDIQRGFDIFNTGTVNVGVLTERGVTVLAPGQQRTFIVKRLSRWTRFCNWLRDKARAERAS